MPAQSRSYLKIRYSPIDEVAVKTGTSVAEIIHAAAHGDFPVYVLAYNWNVSAFTMDQESGTWISSSLKPSTYTGPIRLYPHDLMRLEANPSAEITELMGDTAGYIGYEPDEEWQFRLVDGPISLKNCTLVMMSTDNNQTQRVPAKAQQREKSRAQNVDGGDEQNVAVDTLSKRKPPQSLSVDFDKLSDESLLRESDLLDSHVVPFSHATLWRKVGAGSFPSPVKISAGISAWRVGDVRSWLNSKK